MNDNELTNESVRLLVDMLDADVGGREPWDPNELADVLEHQLAAPLTCDLDDADGTVAGQLAALAATVAGPVASFGDLLHHEQPPLELLERTRQFAKACRIHPDSPLPDEIATVLYFMSIVAALLRLDRRITRMDDAALRYSLDWALRQTWLDEATRHLFEEGQAALRASET